MSVRVDTLLASIDPVTRLWELGWPGGRPELSGASEDLAKPLKRVAIPNHVLLINSVMAAAAFMGLIGCFEDQQRRQDAIAQADNGVADFAFFVESRDFEV
jgi:hypothetical protein